MAVVGRDLDVLDKRLVRVVLVPDAGVLGWKRADVLNSHLMRRLHVAHVGVVVLDEVLVELGDEAGVNGCWEGILCGDWGSS